MYKPLNITNGIFINQITYIKIICFNTNKLLLVERGRKMVFNHCAAKTTLRRFNTNVGNIVIVPN